MAGEQPVKASTNHPPRAGRQCGGCTACCTGLEIESRPGISTTFHTGEDIAKAAGERCRFAAETGCTIYEHRPLTCRNFKCDWLIGRDGYTQEDSPSNIGIIGVRGTAVDYKRLNKSA